MWETWRTLMMAGGVSQDNPVSPRLCIPQVSHLHLFSLTSPLKTGRATILAATDNYGQRNILRQFRPLTPNLTSCMSVLMKRFREAPKPAKRGEVAKGVHVAYRAIYRPATQLGPSTSRPPSALRKIRDSLHDSISIILHTCLHIEAAKFSLLTEEIGTTLNIEVKRANEGRGKQEIPEKTHRPAASFGTIPRCENMKCPGRGWNPDRLAYKHAAFRKPTLTAETSSDCFFPQDCQPFCQCQGQICGLVTEAMSQCEYSALQGQRQGRTVGLDRRMREGGGARAALCAYHYLEQLRSVGTSRGYPTRKRHDLLRTGVGFKKTGAGRERKTSGIYNDVTRPFGATLFQSRHYQSFVSGMIWRVPSALTYISPPRVKYFVLRGTRTHSSTAVSHAFVRRRAGGGIPRRHLAEIARPGQCVKVGRGVRTVTRCMHSIAERVVFAYQLGTARAIFSAVWDCNVISHRS
ncbi:hypothetical protein PR048_014874 [Dryococelus australis]|uniref:Uncharacterized protein n=1 Tax=Dryococelus australis TaxID=614101 RepID=A0ABQ9HFC1_9NEOP|nr:hypothetical protein PR048_014874 [Dryococelus australis]